MDGHFRSAFRADREVLFFAHVPEGGCGGAVSAHDLRTGAGLWRTTLEAIGSFDHSAYDNKATMDLTRLPGVDAEDEGAVVVTGTETCGDYVEVLDRKTGKRLAHKVYRRLYAPKGWAQPEGELGRKR